MIELKEGTFLVLEMVQEYENSGNCIRMQGKYLPVIRRGILLQYGLPSGDNDYCGRLWKDNRKIMVDYQKTMVMMKDYD